MEECWAGDYPPSKEQAPVNSHKTDSVSKTAKPAENTEGLRASFEMIRDSKKALVLEASQAHVAKLRSLIAPLQHLCPDLKLGRASTAVLDKLNIKDTYDLLLELKIGDNAQVIGILNGDTSINVTRNYITPTGPVREFGRRMSNTEVYNLDDDENCAKFQSQALYMAAITTGIESAMIDMGLSEAKGIKTLRKNADRAPSV
tara:strand:- start:329 stop:934 length:606 start_codon:yes stop_codon:yes gene_type:complete